jgi:hypothetical protein
MGEDLFRICDVDMLALLNTKCGSNVKAQQRGEPEGGYRTHIGGILAANSSDNLCLDWDWFRNSESITSSIYFTARLFHTCPHLLKLIKIIAQDDACHYKKQLQAQLRRLMKQRGDTPAMALFREMLSKVIVVDQFHFRNHTDDDEYCMRETNPTLDEIPVGAESEHIVHDLQSLLEGENSESSEQLFRWMGLLKHIINQMSLSRATYFMHRMVWLKNERTIRENCMDKMNAAEVRRVRAAYGLEGRERITPTDRLELAQLLLSCSRDYDLESAEYLKWQSTYGTQEDA